MATDLERLQVTLDADIKKFENAMNRALGITNKQMGAIQKQTESAMKKVGLSLGDISKTFTVGFAAVGSIKGFQDLADASTRVQNSLKVAGLSGSELTKVYDALFASAQKNAVPVESLVTLYGRMSLVQKDLGASTQDMLTFTDDVGKALRVAGTDAVTAQGALLQLSQALGSGTVHSEEFNSVLEGALPILQAAALGITQAGGSVSKLKQLVAAGDITSQQLFRGFLDGASILDERLKGSVLTVDQALVRLKNSLLDTVGRVNDLTGISQEAVHFISLLGDEVESLSRLLTAAANTDMGKLIGKLKAINDLIVKNLPGLGQLYNLPGPETFDKIADAMAPANPVEKLNKARQDFAAEIDKAVTNLGGDLSEKEQKQLEDLSKGLRDGSASADDAQKALDGLGEKFRRMAGFMQPYIKGLNDATAAAKTFNEEQAKATFTAPGYVVGNRVAQETTAKRDAFLAQDTLDAQRTELEKQIDTRAKSISAAAAKLGIALTDAAAKIQAKADIASETATKSLDSTISSYVSHVDKSEGRGNNPNSSASGIGQFIESTWISLFKQYFPDRAAGMTNAAILALRDDEATANQLIEAYARQNAAILQKAGVSVNEAALQLAHFLGPQGAISILKAAPNTPVSQLLDQSAIKANPTILGNGATAGDVLAYAQRRAGMTTTGTQLLDSRDAFAKEMKQQQQELAALKAETGIRQQLNPLVKDYGRQMSAAEKAQELLEAAQQEGTAAGKELTDVQQLLNGDLSKLSPEAQKQALAMRALANEYGNVEAASNKLKESQEQAQKASADQLQLAKDVTGGVLSDIRTALEDGKITWKEWGDIAVNALNKIADHLQDALLDQIFKPGSFGFLGSLFGGGTSTGSSSGSGGFAFGGYTGPGGKFQPAGIVHKGEYVFSQDDVQRIGLRNLQRLRGYANGGPVGMPSLPSLSGMSAGGQRDTSHLVVSVDDDGKIAAYVARQGRLTEVSVLQKSKAAMDVYRAGKFHDDWERHAGNRKVKGISS